MRRLPYHTLRAAMFVFLSACGADSKDVSTSDSSMGTPSTTPTTEVQSCTDDVSAPADGVEGPFTSFRVNPFLQLNETDSVWVVWDSLAKSATSGAESCMRAAMV